LSFLEPTSPQDEVDEYFKALGGGSRAEMADPPKEDDDDQFEKQTEVTRDRDIKWMVYFYSVHMYINDKV